MKSNREFLLLKVWIINYDKTAEHEQVTVTTESNVFDQFAYYLENLSYSNIYYTLSETKGSKIDVKIKNFNPMFPKTSATS